MIRFSLTAFAALMIATGPATAAPFPQSPFRSAFGFTPDTGLGSSTIASEGPATVTGITGDLQTVTLPDGSGQALLQDNGNDTSTLVGPDGRREVVITPH
jgi:hypothetical protein